METPATDTGEAQTTINAIPYISRNYCGRPPFIFWLYHWCTVCSLSAPVQFHNAQTNNEGFLAIFTFVLHPVKISEAAGYQVKYPVFWAPVLNLWILQVELDIVLGFCEIVISLHFCPIFDNISLINASNRFPLEPNQISVKHWNSCRTKIQLSV